MPVGNLSAAVVGPHQAGPNQAGRHQAGFTYIAVLLLVALLSVGLAVAGPQWSDAQQRDREDELLRVGRIYAQAITDYYQSSPGSVKHYPATLNELLLDSRYLGTRRHVRRLHTDPLRPGQPLALVRAADGGIRGIYSASELPPLRQGVQRLDGMADLPAATQYNQWKFIAEPTP